MGDYKPADLKEKTENFFVADQNASEDNNGFERSRAGVKEHKWDPY